ncbi:Hsp33 family molecular chaperone HslO [Zophobihabitans entericus]|uniref:33 kDa chaperonin n=1 Tax=Zophobihabitans entericus TaxID=1635327 RepID=A0A6G9IDR2_9GAMM|nr:Hsp33 family molecular chaperone HslO [Zophobihabitans entericus]
MNHHDLLSRFLFEEHSVRGEMVTLNKTYQAMLDGHDYPAPVQKLLGDLLTATCLLTATIKFEGDIAVQIQGDGPLSLAVINGNNHQDMRGVARVTGEITDKMTLKEMVGNGYLVITIMPSQGERYQGIVGLEHETVAECIEGYFMQSEQLPTRLFVHTGVYHGQPVTSGVLLQVLPASDASPDSFEHLAMLTHTMTADELFSLPVQEVLHRLYHEEDVRLFDATSVQFKCTCSRERCEASLATLPATEIDTILEEDGNIDMHCDYCGNHYIFDAIDIQQMRAHQKSESTH